MDLEFELTTPICPNKRSISREIAESKKELPIAKQEGPILLAWRKRRIGDDGKGIPTMIHIRADGHEYLPREYRISPGYHVGHYPTSGYLYIARNDAGSERMSLLDAVNTGGAVQLPIDPNSRRETL